MLTSFRLCCALSSLVVVLGCTERIVYVYPDGGEPADAPVSPPIDTAAPEGDVAASDAGERTDAPRGSCEPDRAPGAVSHTDCRSVADRPICDAVGEVCVGVPTDYCGACSTDADCGNFDINAQCVFIAGDAPFNNDQACLPPCTTAADCDFLRSDWSNVACMALGAGSFCVPNWGGTPHCRDSSGARR